MKIDFVKLVWCIAHEFYDLFAMSEEIVKKKKKRNEREKIWENILQTEMVAGEAVSANEREWNTCHVV